MLGQSGLLRAATRQQCSCSTSCVGWADSGHRAQSAACHQPSPPQPCPSCPAQHTIKLTAQPSPAQPSPSCPAQHTIKLTAQPYPLPSTAHPFLVQPSTQSSSKPSPAPLHTSPTHPFLVQPGPPQPKAKCLIASPALPIPSPAQPPALSSQPNQKPSLVQSSLPCPATRWRALDIYGDRLKCYFI